jgi:phenylacetate-CoA ligase
VRFRGGVAGRIDDVFIIRGVNVFPSAIENIVRRFDEVDEFAVDVYRRSELDEIELRFELRTGDGAAIARALSAALREALQLRALVVPVATGTLPRFELKAKRFCDHRVL